MRDAKIAILEDQLDTLAGRLADAEERFERLLKFLTTGQVPKKLGLDGAEIKSRCDAVMSGSQRWKHEGERRRRLAKAELDDFRRRVADAESIAERSGRSFVEAWEAARENDETPRSETTRAPAAARPGPTVWDQALAHLSAVVNRYSFITWFQDTSLVRDDVATIVVLVQDAMAAAWLEKNYASEIAAALAAVGRPGTSVRFVEGDEEDAQS